MSDITCLYLTKFTIRLAKAATAAPIARANGAKLDILDAFEKAIIAFFPCVARM